MDTINRKRIPKTLRDLRQWIVWKTVDRDGKPTKVPYQVNGAEAKSNDPQTWTDFETAIQAYESGGYDGPGFVFLADGGLCGIDLDGCRNPVTGRVEEWAREVLLRFKTYAEVSPSKTGVKLFCLARSFSDAGKKKNLPDKPKIAGKLPGVEIYDRLRYFAVTGWQVKGPSEPQEAQDAVKWFGETYFSEQTNRRKVADFYGDDSVQDRARKYLAKMPPAVSGQSGHNATFKVACTLVLGFGLSSETATVLLREYNATCQPPWSERELAHKIDSAAQQTGPRNYLRNVPIDKWESVKLPEYKETRRQVRSEPRHVTIDEAVAEYTKSITDGTANLIPIGIPELDTALSGGLEWGEMVVIAGRPSHGKSAIALQIIHNMAALGYSSLLVLEEMSSRAVGKRTLTFSTNVPQERWRQHLEEVKKHYSDFSSARAACHIVEACRNADVAIEQIEKAIDQWKVRVVVIDYVQLLGSVGKGRYEEVTKTSIAIRQVTNQHKLITFAVCQMNRGIENRPKFTPKLSDLKECVTGNTLVALGDGRRVSIASLVGISPDVLCVDPRKQITTTKSSEVWFVGKRSVLDIRTKSGRTISVTRRHHLLTGKGWTQAGRIQVGERLAIARQLPAIADAAMKEHELILLAHLIGDGSYLTNQPLRYTTGNDECSRAVTTAAKMFGSAVTVTRYDYKPGWHQLVIAGNGNRWHSAGVGKWLKDIGVWNQRSKNKHIPDCVFRIPQQQLAMFLRHLWATDGCIHINRRGNKTFACTHLATASERLASDVAFLLLRFGIVARISKRHKDGVISVVISGVDNLRRFANDIGAFGDRRKQLIGLVEWLKTAQGNTNVDTLPRETMAVLRRTMLDCGMKQSEMSAAVGVAHAGSRYHISVGRDVLLRYANVLKSEELQDIATSDLFWDSVESISDGGVQDVYDLTVPGHANWLSNGGIVTHNSGQLEQDSDVVIFAVWPYRLDETRNANDYQLFIAKNRNREIRNHVVSCQFIPTRQMLVGQDADKMAVLDHLEGDGLPLNRERAFDAFRD